MRLWINVLKVDKPHPRLKQALNRIKYIKMTRKLQLYWDLTVINGLETDKYVTDAFKNAL